MTVGEKIYFYRKQCALSQEDLAERVGISRQAVSKWETGDALPDVDKLLPLARIFGVTVDELLTPQQPGENSPEPSSQSAPPHAKSAFYLSAMIRFIKQYGFLVGIPISAYGVVFLYEGFIVAATGGQLTKAPPTAFVAGILQTVGIFQLLAGIVLLIGGAALAKHLWDRRNSIAATDQQAEKSSPED